MTGPAEPLPPRPRPAAPGPHRGVRPPSPTTPHPRLDDDNTRAPPTQPRTGRPISITTAHPYQNRYRRTSHRRWYGDCLPSQDFPMLVDLYLAGRLNLDGFVTEEIGIADIETAFEKMHHARWSFSDQS